MKHRTYGTGRIGAPNHAAVHAVNPAQPYLSGLNAYQCIRRVFFSVVVLTAALRRSGRTARSV